MPKKAIAVVEERKCPVEGCDSAGHLGGHFEKHFTQEACPLFHNMTLGDTKAWRLERIQREEERRKATILYDPMKKSTTVEQKSYQLKVKEIRSHFKPNPPSPMRHMSHSNANQPLELKREPNLMGFVSDYDLQLFREAHAIASEKMEMDLLKLPPERGTKYVKCIYLRARAFFGHFVDVIW